MFDYPVEYNFEMTKHEEEQLEKDEPSIKEEIEYHVEYEFNVTDHEKEMLGRIPPLVVEEPVKDPEPDEKMKKFSFAAQRVLLTYKTHIEKVKLIEHLSKILQRRLVSKDSCIMAHEMGKEEEDKSPYPHTHVAIEMGSRFQTTNIRFFDYEGIHPNIKTLRSKKAFFDAVQYLSKEDPENADLKDKNIITCILATNTPIEALTKYCNSVSEASGILAIHGLKGMDFRTKMPDWSKWEPRPWQKEIIEIVSKPVDKRKVYWVYDQVGETGKTELGKFLRDTMNEKVLYQGSPGTYRDAATTISNIFLGGWRGDTMIFNLPRSSENNSDLYHTLEAVKDGEMSINKYKGGQCCFDPQTIIVMSNWAPQTQLMSQDRWHIWKMTSNQEMKTITNKVVFDYDFDDPRCQIFDLNKGNILTKQRNAIPEPSSILKSIAKIVEKVAENEE